MPLVSDDTFRAAAERTQEARSLVVDLETSGLRPYLGDRLFAVAVLCDDDDEGFYFPFRHRQGRNLEPRKLPLLLDLICSFDRPATPRLLGGHNFIRFDCPMIAMEDERYAHALLHDDRIPKWDTIIDALLANENEESFSLYALGLKYLGGDAAEKHTQQERLLASLRAIHPKLRAKRQLMGHMIDLSPEQVCPYALGDVLDTRGIRRVYIPHLEEWGLTKLAWEMYAYARLLARIERRGLLIDKAECERRVVRCEEEIATLTTRLRRESGIATFNPNSTPQIKALLRTEDAEAETVLRSGHPLAPLIVECKQLRKMKGTYYEGILARLDSAGVVHPQMNLTADPHDEGGTGSARLSCSHPNFQNLPKRSPKWYMRVRELVVARPGCVINPNDYERAEMWLGGHYSMDESLFEAYHQGRDLYAELAARTATDRQGGKIDWLAIQYGARGRKLSEMHNWPYRNIASFEREFGKFAFPDRNPRGYTEQWGDAEWRAYKAQKGVQVVDGFFALCPGIKDMMRNLEERAIKVGYMPLWTGRIIHFDGYRTPPFVAWNRLIQGGVGEMMRKAMQKLEPILDDAGADMLLQVHDEIVNEIPEAQTRRVIEATQDVMTDFDFRLRPRVESLIGRAYGTVEKWAA